MRQDQLAVANNYAEAVMQIAAQSGAEKTILENLKAVSQAMAATPDFETLLRHPSISSEEKKKLIVSVFGTKVNELTLRLLEMLADKRRLDLLSSIEYEYTRLWREKQGIVAGTLSYAERPDSKVLNDIKAKVQAKLGKQLELEEKEDKSLIGGYVLQLGDQVIDGSLKGRLQSIEKALLSV